MPEPVRRLAVVAAGGTGGHLFPAQALAAALIERGWRIMLATDARAEALSAGFPAERRIALSAATARPGDPVGMARAGMAILAGALEARRVFAQARPSVVVGFGGYPSLPALAAAISRRTPTVIHEQNAVMGRANRLLARHVSAIACAFPALQNAPAAVLARARALGNPVRPEIRTLFRRGYAPPAGGGEVRLLATGGSQGARLLSECVPDAVARLPLALRVRLKVVQQVRAEALERARATYAAAGVAAEIAPFLTDMAARLEAAHLVIGRAGASTVSELAVAGRPAILVPLGIALDDDQGQNARVLQGVGAAEIMPEAALTSELLATALERLLTAPDRLAAMAAAAARVARPDAAERLADLVEETAAP